MKLCLAQPLLLSVQMNRNWDKTSLRKKKKKKKRMQKIVLMKMGSITFQLIHLYILPRLLLLMIQNLHPLHQDINMNPYMTKLKKKSRRN